MYHINVILIFFIVFLAKTRVLTRKSCQFDKKKPRRAHISFVVSTKVQMRFFRERNKAFMV